MHEFYTLFLSGCLCSASTLFAMYAAVPTLSSFATKLDPVGFSAPSVALIFYLSVFSSMKVVFEIALVVRLVTVRKLALAALCSNWTINCSTPFTFSCESAAGFMRVTFIVTSLIAQNRDRRSPFNNFKLAPVSRTAVTVFHTTSMSTEEFTLYYFSLKKTSPFSNPVAFLQSLSIFFCTFIEHNTSMSFSINFANFGCDAVENSLKQLFDTVLSGTVLSFSTCTVDLTTVLPVTVLSSTVSSFRACTVVLLSCAII